MIKVTSVRNEETFAINEDYIIALYDVPDENAKENAVLLMDAPKGRENELPVAETMDELYYEINRS